MFKKPGRTFGRIVRTLNLSVLLSAALGMSLTTAWAQPANDNFGSAKSLLSQDTGTTTGSNLGATLEPGEIHSVNVGGASVWFTWKANQDGVMSFDTIGSDFDTILEVYTGSTGANQTGTLVAKNDDLDPSVFGPQNFTGASGVMFNVTAGTTYYILIDGYNGSTGSYNLNWKRGGSRSSGEFEFSSATYFATETEGISNRDPGYNDDIYGALITVTRKNGSSGKVYVDYTTADDPTAQFPAAANTNYTKTTGKLVFEDHQMSATFVVPILNRRSTNDTSFLVELTGAYFPQDVNEPAESDDLAPPILNAARSEASVEIASVRTAPPDAGTIQFERAYYRRREGVGTAHVRVTRVGGDISQAVTFNYYIDWTSDGLNTRNNFRLSAGSDYATPNVDYTAPTSSTQATIGAYQSFVDIAIPIANDQLVEFNEDLYIQFDPDNPPTPKYVPPSGATPASGYKTGKQDWAILTIMFDDYPAGAVDESYNQDFSNVTTPAFNAHPGANNTVYSTDIQSDGKAVIGGSFNSYNGTVRNHIARINANGMVDSSFNPSSGANDFVASLKVMPNSQIVIGGGFTSYNGIPRASIARLNADGSLDTSFNPGLGANGTVWAVALQPDGKVVIGGDFTQVNKIDRNNIARLNADGSVDETFDPGTGVDGIVFAVSVNSDGTIALGGEFREVNGVKLNSIARLKADGSVDAAFIPGDGVDGTVYTIASRANGSLLIGGSFSQVDTQARNNLAALKPNGRLDTSFDCGTGPNDTVYSIIIQPDGRPIIGGLFTSVNGTRRMGLSRLLSTGPVDTSFLDTAYNQFAGLVKSYDNLNVEPNNFVFSVSLEGNGNVIIGGSFDKVGGGRGDSRVRPEQVRLDDRTRATYRNRRNVARLLGGETPGPGNIEFAFDSYSADESTSSRFIELVRSNGRLGSISAGFSLRTVPGGATENDFQFQARYGNPTWTTSWNRNGTTDTWMQSDGFFGLNNVSGPFNDARATESHVYIDLIDNSIIDGDRNLILELTRPKGAGGIIFNNSLASDKTAEWSLGGEYIALGAALGRSSAPFTIVDDDAKPGEFNFSAPEFFVSKSGGTNAVVTVTRSNGSNGRATVQYRTDDGTALKGVNYKQQSGTLTFQAGVTNQTIQIPIIGSTPVANDKTFTVTLFNPSGKSKVGAISNAIVTIVEDKFAPGHINFTSGSFIGNEGEPYAAITLSRRGGSQGTIEVQVITTPGGTAAENIRYLGVTNTVHWDDRDFSIKTVNIPLLDDDVVEGTETVFLEMKNAYLNGVANTSVLGITTNAILKINDNDEYGVFGFNSAKYFAMENAGSKTITVIRRGGVAGTVSITCTVTNNSLVTPYPLVFQPGELSKTITIPISDNEFANPDLVLGLGLELLTPGASLDLAQATLTIIDDESSVEPPGTVDNTFNLTGGMNDFVHALAIQTDGKLLVGGDFTSANHVGRNRIARFNSNGSLDLKFSSSSTLYGADNSVRSIVPQSDGKILIGGLFTTVNGVTRKGIARLRYDGTIDTTFDPLFGANNPVYAIAETTVNGERKILAVGNFTTFNGLPRNGIVRLNSDGRVDSSFAASGVGGTNATIYSLAVQPNGKILVGGDFVTFNGVPTPHIVRLNADGTLDSNFSPGIGPDASVRAIAVQADGKIVIGGLFTHVNGSSLNHLARLNANGTVDATFNIGVGVNDSVYAIVVQPDDGKILVGGEFTRANDVTRNRITRLNPDGSVDTSINFGLGADSFIAAVALEPRGNLFVGGGFSHFDGTVVPHLARVFGRSVSGSGRLEFTSATYQVNENAEKVVITVRRQGGTEGTVSVRAITSNGTAIAGVDYEAVSTNLVFAPGETIRTFTIPIIDNDLIEQDKTVLLSLVDATTTVLGNQTSAILTIRNDDSAISFASASFRVPENAENGGAVIEIIRSGSSIGTSTVDFLTTTNGTARPMDHFTLVTNTVTFKPGETQKLVIVPVFNNNLPEGDRTVELVLTNPSEALLKDPYEAVLTIVEDDYATGQLAFSQPEYSVSEAGDFATITVIRTNGSLGFVQVAYSASGGTAVPGRHYTPTNGVLTFGPGEISKSFQVKVFDDNLPEGDRTVLLTLSSPQGTTILGTNQTMLTILEDDAAFMFSTPAYLVNEGDGRATITVYRLFDSNHVASVSYRTSDGTATNGSKYLGRTNTLTFAAGESLKTFDVPILENSIVEGDQYFFVSLFNPVNAQLGYPSNAIVTITDNDSSLSFSASEYVVDEGATNVAITVIRTNTSAGMVSINFSTSNLTATAGQDYMGTNFTLVLLDGEASKTVLIPVMDDLLVEGDETFAVYLSNPSSNAIVGIPGSAIVTIIDNDAGLKFASSNFRVPEDGVNATITVLRTGNTNSTVSVSYKTADGTATQGLDYISVSGVLTFTNGETVKTFQVPIIDDTLIEGDETVLLSLFSPVGQAAIIPPGAAVLTIVDNDGSLIVPAGSALVSESFTPTNGVIDPGETVSLYFSFRNSVGMDTANLVATLLPGDGITSPSGPQSYGVLKVSGHSVPRLFSFTASGTNGQRITATFHLQDGAFDLGTASFTYTLGSTKFSFTNAAQITINDSSSPPTAATPFPSTLNVSGVNGNVSKVSVTLSNLSHTFPNDVDVLLVSPTGQKIVLMSGCGGGVGITNTTITFDDSSYNTLPHSGTISSGTFKPSAYNSAPVFPVPAPPGPYASSLAMLNGINPNGNWSLYVSDNTFFNSGKIINGWRLTIETSSGITPTADLSVAITDSPDPTSTGAELTYTVTVVNHGPSPATGIVITNILPAGVTFVSDTCHCVLQTNNSLICPLESLPRGGFVSFNVVVIPNQVGVITNTAYAYANEVDPNLLNNVAVETTTVDIPRADLAIALSGTPNPVQINGNLTYSMVVSNLGPVTATGVMVTNTLPPNTTPSSIFTSQGSYSVAGNNVIFNLGNLAKTTPYAPVAATMTIVVQPTVDGTITDFASVGSDVSDLFKSNNNASIKTAVLLPSIQLRPSGGGLMVIWGTNAPGYVLQTTTNLSSTSVWTTVNSTPVLLDNQNSCVIDLSEGTRFFRLAPAH